MSKSVRDALQQQKAELNELRLSYLVNFAVEVAQSRPEAELRIPKGGCPTLCHVLSAVPSASLIAVLIMWHPMYDMLGACSRQHMRQAMITLTAFILPVVCRCCPNQTAYAAC